VALSDIIERINGDAATEADALVDAAQAQAEAALAAAREQAERESAVILARGAADAAAEAETLRAAARLAGRDQLVAAKGKLVDRALGGAVRAVVELPDHAYSELMARRVAAASRGGERVLIAEADRTRLEARLSADVDRAAGRDLGLVYGEEPAEVEHGVILLGDRSAVDLSVAALIEERRGEIAMLAASELFGDGESTGE